MCLWKTANTPVSEFLLVKNIGSSSFIVDFFIYLTWNDGGLDGSTFFSLAVGTLLCGCLLVPTF